MFYCHFPDLLLVKKKSFIRNLYRLPINWIEGFTTGMADIIMVNSEFTQSTFKKTFPSIQKPLHVVYPSIDIEKFERLLNKNQTLNLSKYKTKEYRLEVQLRNLNL